MKIGNNSALLTGVQGFTKAKQQMQEAANTIATGDQVTDLTQPIVDLKVSELNAKANAKVIETAAETSGFLLDIKV